MSYRLLTPITSQACPFFAGAQYKDLVEAADKEAEELEDGLFAWQLMRAGVLGSGGEERARQEGPQ